MTWHYFRLVQERLTKDIAEALTQAIHPAGVAVVVEAMLVNWFTCCVREPNLHLLCQAHVYGDERSTESEQQDID